MKLYIGTSGYAYKEWKGKFYPEKISAREMLRFYSGRFDAVEINNTFYRRPTEGLLTSWAAQVPEDFIFTFKAPQIITHMKLLRNVEEDEEEAIGPQTAMRFHELADWSGKKKN